MKRTDKRIDVSVTLLIITPGDLNLILSKIQYFKYRHFFKFISVVAKDGPM